ncbi:MAG: DUF4372 domain-containing protein [Saprospiraceae bacterium]|nr:DUF4372 domain-containing protein [Saprospiraceae bacterium]
MNDGTYVFAQLMQLIHRQAFAKLVDRYGGNYRVGTCTSWHLLRCMSFGQNPNGRA